LARIATTFKPTTNYQWLTALLLGQNERGLAFVSRLVKQKITTKNKKKEKTRNRHAHIKANTRAEQ